MPRNLNLNPNLNRVGRFNVSTVERFNDPRGPKNSRLFGPNWTKFGLHLFSSLSPKTPPVSVYFRLFPPISRLNYFMRANT